MILVEVTCQMCGKRFEAEILDDDDPRERNRGGGIGYLSKLY